MQAFNALAFNRETTIDPLVSIIVLLTSGILAFALAIYLFNWDSRNETRRGSPVLGLLILVPYLLAILYTSIS
jgi:hypothetical protein